MAIVDWLKDVALACLLVSLGGPVFGDSPNVITLPPGEAVQLENVHARVELLEDSAGGMDIAAVAVHPGFVAATPATANVGFTHSAWWVRLRLRNPGDAPRLVYLRQHYPLIDSLDLYRPDASGNWVRQATGDRQPFAARSVAHRDFLFPLQLPARADATFYLRYASQGPVDINLSLLGPDEVTAAVSREQMAYGIYFGCVLMLLVWAGLVFLAVRDSAFLAYFAYVATFGLYMFVNTGLAFQYLWPDSPVWANTCLIVLLNLAMVTALQFSVTILRARDHTPRLARVARVMQLLGLLGALLSPVLPYAALVQPTTFLILLSVIYLLTLGVVSMVSGSRPARFFVIAWSSFLAGSLIFLFKNFGVVPHTFFTQHSWQIGSLVEMILLSMSLSSRMSELKHQSRTDALTLLGNRRLFDDKLPATFAAALESRAPLSLMVLDIDNFKEYNDRHGHAQGDDAVKQVGKALRRYARKPVLACRYGGDEFCVILPGTDARTAAIIAERLRATLQGARNDERRITISVGYATMTGGNFSSPEKLFEAADAALYSAKEAGRNRISAFQGRRADDTLAG
jgi:diguanylate cyclase (GGDEF)-like protein